MGRSTQGPTVEQRLAEAEFHMSEGIRKANSGDSRAAVNEFTTALKLFATDPQSMSGIAGAWMSIAQVFRNDRLIQNLPKVLAEAKSVLRFAEGFPNSHPEKAETYRILGECFSLCDVSDVGGDCEPLALAESCFNSAVQLHKLNNDPRNEAAACHMLGTIYHERYLRHVRGQPCGNALGFEQGVRAYQSAEAMNARIGNAEGVAMNRSERERLERARRDLGGAGRR